MWRATLQGLLGHKLRVSLAALSVVLGVSFISGTFVLSDTLTRTFDVLFQDINRGVDVTVRAAVGFSAEHGPYEERPTVPARLLDVVREVPGVAEVEGDVSGYAQLVRPDGEPITTQGAPTLGVAYSSGFDRALTIVEGRPPSGAGEVAVDRVTARRNDLRLGQRVTVLTTGAPAQYTIVGIARFGDADGLGGATLTIFDVPTAQRALDRVGAYDAIAVSAEPDVSAAALQERITRALPSGFEVRTGQQVADEDAEGVQQFLDVFSTVLLVFAGVSLFVAAFIIVNTFSILITQRTRELALLRALGASRSQVLRSVLGEAAVIGTVASLVGLAAGFGVAVLLRSLLNAVGFGLPESGAVFRPRTAVVSLLVGLGVTLVAAVGPARRASRVPPVAAMREDTWVPAPRSLRRRTAAGAALAALGCALLGLGLFGPSGNRLPKVGTGAVAAFLGVALLSPLLVPSMSRVVGAPLARLGIAGRLGRENALRNPRRTASTAAALMVGLALVSCVSVVAASVQASAGEVIDRNVGADFIVQSDGFVGHSPEVAKRLRAVPAVAAAAEVRGGVFRVDGDTTGLTGMDPSTVDLVLRLDVRTGSLSQLRPGGVLVDESVAADRGITAGDRVEVEFAGSGDTTLRVAGTFAKNELVGGWLITLADYDRHFTNRLSVVTAVAAEEDADLDEVRAAIERELDAFPNLEALDRTQIKEEQEDQINQALALVFALLGLAIVIALIGIVNTLALSVYERTRELGLLRAVGMSRRQVRRMIRAEAVIIAVLGASLGTALGVLLGTALVRALADEGLGTLTYPVGSLASYVALAALAGVVAAVLPARRAARLDVLAAISHS